MLIVQIFGRLGGDPVVRYTASNLKVTSFTVAANIRRKDKEETVWVRVTCFGEKHDYILNHLKKGSAVIVYGNMNKPEIFTNREGQPQVSLDVVAEAIHFNPFGNSSPRQEGGEPSQDQYQPQQQQQSNYNSRAPFAGSSGTQQVTSGQSMQHAPNMSMEEEPLPF